MLQKREINCINIWQFDISMQWHPDISEAKILLKVTIYFWWTQITPVLLWKYRKKNVLWNDKLTFNRHHISLARTFIIDVNMQTLPKRRCRLCARSAVFKHISLAVNRKILQGNVLIGNVIIPLPVGLIWNETNDLHKTANWIQMTLELILQYNRSETNIGAIRSCSAMFVNTGKLLKVKNSYL